MDLRDFQKRLCSLVLMSMVCVLAFAQGKQIHGVIKDNFGEPVIGVNVLLKGTSNGTITNLDGNFTLSGVSNNDILVVSYIGFVTQEIPVGTQTEFNVLLKEDSETLDEVVVIGYGTVKRRDLTGSVASVSNESLIANPVADVAQALQGKLPGVTITSQDGRPGADMSIRVRGGGSVTQSNDPLFVVDGFPVSSISDIPADQIESIDVLKDASSTAIYGARGANGVILVTTKGAKEEKVTVSYNGYIQIKNAKNVLDGMDAQDYVLHTWSYATAYGSAAQSSVEGYFGLGSSNGNYYTKYTGKSHNWTDDLLQTAISHSHNFTISGGGQKTKMVLTANYVSDEGTKINSGYSRFSANFKLDQELLRNLKFNLDVRYAETDTEGKEVSTNGRGSVLSSAYRYKPIDNPYGGDFSDFSSGFGNGDVNIDDSYNPVSRTEDVVNIVKKHYVRAIASLSWDIIDGLNLRTEFGAGRNDSETKYWENGLTNSYKLAKLTNGDGYNLRWATTLNYEVKGLGEDHSLSFLLGNEMLASKSNTNYIQGAGYVDGFTMDDAFGLINMTDSSLGLDEFGATEGTPSKTVSFFARVNYSFKGRYLLTGTFRADGSSKFAPGNRWGYFPAGAFAWRISDEPFMENTTDWLSNLKLRLSYGLSGADNIDPSLWQETWEAENLTIDGTSTSGYVNSGLKPNEDLKWETTISRNLGIDFGFWNGRLNGSIDLYWNTTKDLLMNVPIDETTGYSYQYQNIGKTSNKGVEIALSYDIIRKKDFNLSVSATYNYNKNRIDELADNVTTEYASNWNSSSTQPSYDYGFYEGESVGLVRGYICDGFYTTSDFDYSTDGTYTLKSGVADLGSSVSGNYPNPFSLADDQTAFPGAMKLRDVNGDGEVNESDVVPLGNINAPHTGGFNINATYKGFDLSASFTWQVGGHLYNATAMSSMTGFKDNGIGANRLKKLRNTYKIYDVNSSGDLAAVTDPDALDALNAGAKYWVPYTEMGVCVSTFVESSDYLRLNTLTIGYTLPKTITKKFGAERLRIYATAGNLFTITGYSGTDPDINADPYKDSSVFPLLGLDWGTYPKSRTFTFGLNLTF